MKYSVHLQTYTNKKNYKHLITYTDSYINGLLSKCTVYLNTDKIILETTCNAGHDLMMDTNSSKRNLAIFVTDNVFVMS